MLKSTIDDARISFDIIKRWALLAEEIGHAIRAPFGEGAKRGAHMTLRGDTA